MLKNMPTSSTMEVEPTHSCADAQSPECSPPERQASPAHSQGVGAHSLSLVQAPLLQSAAASQCAPSAAFDSSSGRIWQAADTTHSPNITSVESTRNITNQDTLDAR